MTEGLPELTEFTPEALDGPTGGKLDVAHRFLVAVSEWFREAGEERTIAELNRLGHSFGNPKPSMDGAWLTWSSLLPDGRHRLDVSWESNEQECMVTSPKTEEAWEADRAAQQDELSPGELAVAKIQERFSVLGGSLFSERYDEWDHLSPSDRTVLSVYTVDMGGQQRWVQPILREHRRGACGPPDRGAEDDRCAPGPPA